MKAIIKRNTDKEYPCVQCGSINANIIREGDDPKLKCNDCNMVYQASVSLDAKEAGAIPEEAPVLQEQAPPPRQPVENKVSSDDVKENAAKLKIPRTVDYVFIAKNRREAEFVSSRDFKKVALKWESAGKNYELYQLNQKKSSVKIDIE